MGKLSRRAEALNLIARIRDACRRPLFVEIALLERRQTGERKHISSELSQTSDSALHKDVVQRKRGRSGDEKTQDWTWEELLFRASQQAPFFTETEYIEVVRLSSILLLGFLMPYSTGNDWLLLRNAKDSHLPGFDPVEYVLNMALEERICKSVRYHAANEYGEINTLEDASLVVAFDSFLSNGLAPLLSCRVIPRDQADLIHVIAMAICPYTSAPVLPQSTLKRLNKRNHSVWQTTKQLMKTNSQCSFGVSYGTRVKLIRLVRDNLTLPEHLDEQSSDVVAPLLYAAIPHLRSALNDFSKSTALSLLHAQLAIATNIKLARSNLKDLKEEWDQLLHSMIEGELCCCGGKTDTCWYWSRCALLSGCFLSECSSIAGINKHAINSVADAIEWQVDLWAIDPEPGDDMQVEHEKKPTLVPCLLVSLLSCAAYWFQRCRVGIPQCGKEEDDPADTLFDASIQLLRHGYQPVVKAATTVLEATLMCRDFSDQSSLLFRVLKEIIESADNFLGLKSVVALASRRSIPFAKAMLKLLLEKSAEDPHKCAAYSIVASISINCPFAAARETDKLIQMLEDEQSQSHVADILTSLLSVRQSRFFLGPQTKSEIAIFKLLTADLMNHWTKYQIARYAMLCGHFAIAERVYDELLSCSLSEKHFLWMTAWRHVAAAEAVLAAKASIGIPEATIGIRSAVTLFRLIDGESSCKSTEECYSFQISFFLLRLDFLDLVVILRQLLREMRLTGKGSTKHTRTYGHWQYVITSFSILAGRIRELGLVYGPQARGWQFTSSLSLLQKSCLFLSKLARCVASDVLHNMTLDVSTMNCGGPCNSLLTAFMKQLDGVVEGLNASVDPTGKAQTVLEIVDGMLMIPLVMPRCLFSPLRAVSLDVMLSAEPGDDQEPSELEVIELSPSLCFSVCCSGQVKGINLDDSSLLIWYRVVYIGPVEEDEVGVVIVDDRQDVDGDEGISTSSIIRRLPDCATVSSITAPLLPGGQFCHLIECPPIVDEGLFRLEVKLGYQDFAGSQWKLLSSGETPYINVRVQRSR